MWQIFSLMSVIPLILFIFDYFSTQQTNIPLKPTAEIKLYKKQQFLLLLASSKT